MKYVVYLVFVFSLMGCESNRVIYLENGTASDDCSSSVDISTSGITTTSICSDGESVAKIKLE